MEKSEKLKYIKGDYIKSENYCLSGENHLANEESFDKMIISYAEYVTAVVEHVSFSSEFIGNSDSDTRIIMEEFNSKRTRAHDKAIMSTLSLNNELIRNGVIFNLDLVGKEKVLDLTSKERREFGGFIFKILAARSIIVSERLEEKNGMNKDNNKDIASSKLKELERNYKVHITGSEDDIYEQVESEKSREVGHFLR